MNSFIKKICAGALVGCFMINAAGCKKEQESSSVTDAADTIGSMAEEDMPFGATITQIKPDSGKVKIDIEYDYRFMSEEEAIKISNYVAALNSVDAELMNNAVYPGYLDKYVEQTGSADLKGYLELCVDNIKTNYIGSDFEFDYILINDCVDETNQVYADRFQSMDANLASRYGDLNITDKKLVSIDIMYSIPDDDGSYSLSRRQGSDSLLFIYTIDGAPYIVL